MSAYDLSICMPARSEQWLSETVKNILRNKRGKTEVIVVLDGQWSEPELEDHKDVRIVYLSESIGQRAAQNMAVRLSTAKYVAKTDAHVAFSEGFDVELMKTFDELGENIVVAPLMKNLHAYDWKCMKCGSRWYQGPTPTKCMKRGKNTSEVLEHPECDGTEFTQRTVFRPRPDTPNSTSYRFDSDLHFQYFPEYKERQKGDLVESMSLQGSFFMATRDNYLKLNLCDETWGSWGQQGSEVALKTWLSGGRVIINKRCWYAHLFRTQSGFSFPYPQSGKAQQKARDICNDIFKNNKWPLQKYPLSWLVEKFAPVPGWSDKNLEEIKKVALNNKSVGILYFTDNELPMKYAWPVRKLIKDIASSKGFELVSSTRKPINMGKNVVTKEPRSYLTMFKQILKGLETMESDIVFMAEHDVLYPSEHFEFIPKDPETFYYDTNWIKVHTDGVAVSWTADQVSGLCAYRQLLIDHYKERIATFDPDNFDRKFEPGSGVQSEQYRAEKPYIDIRHGKNLTFNKRDISHFRKKDTAVDFKVFRVEDIEGWPELTDILS